MKNQFGWNGFFEKTFNSHYNEEFYPGRVIAKQNNVYKILTQNGEMTFNNALYDLKIVLGDFIVLNKNDQSIHNLLPRQSEYKEADGSVLASNFDTIFMIQSLPQLESKKVEKMVMNAWESGAVPVIVLTKDSNENYHNKISEVKLVSPGVDVFVVDIDTLDGLHNLYQYLKSDKTVAFLGAHNASKETLIHHLVENDQLSLTSQEIYSLPNGSMIINFEEINNASENESIDSYQDIVELVTLCRFHNCTHTNEPDCAILDAISMGKLTQDRLNLYLKEQKKATELSLEDSIRFDYNKKKKELYNKGRRKEPQW